jgi:hypothetical protein
MPPIALGNFLHDVIDRKFRGDFTAAVPANAICKHGKEHGHPVISAQHK